VPFYKQVLDQYNKINVVEKGKNYFEIIATLALLIVLLLLIFPAIKHITGVYKEISDAKKVKIALEEKIIALSVAQDNLKAIENDRPLLELALPTGSDLGTYLKKVEELASKYNLKITAIQFSNVPLAKPTQKESLKVKGLSYNLTLQGGFPDFQKFLVDLENYIRTSDVTSLSISKDQSGGLKEGLSVTSYYFGVDFLPSTKKTSGAAGSEIGGAQ
jgi:Tfp pilus assembly protein PilO